MLTTVISLIMNAFMTLLCGVLIACGIIFLAFLSLHPDLYRPILHALASGFRSLKKWLVNFARFARQELTGKVPDDEVINTSLVLTNEEVKQLLSLLESKFYVLPVLIQYDPNIDGILWLDISAVGVHPEYDELSLEERKKIMVHIIQGFYFEKRGFYVLLFLKVVTSTRLYLAIPLSKKGQRFLENQEVQSIILPDETEKKAPDSLTEEVPHRNPDSPGRGGASGEDRLS